MNPQMTMTTGAVSGHLRDGARSRIARHRRVRSSYPSALVELALVLCGTVGTREAASTLGVGMSTVYRWMGLHRTAWMPRNVVHNDGQPIDDVVVALSTRCERAGFSLRAPSNRNAIASTDHSADPSRVFPHRAETNHLLKGGETTTNSGDITETMQRAKREIENNFATHLSCQTLADRVGMPRFQFIKKFAATFGVPPYHYLLGIRVKQAWELLQRSDVPLPAVAAATGFGSAASMQRAFKRFAGASPSKVVNVIAAGRHFVCVDSYAAQKLPEGQTASA
jgi:AraC-like DNA-binding protein